MIHSKVISLPIGMLRLRYFKNPVSCVHGNIKWILSLIHSEIISYWAIALLHVHLVANMDRIFGDNEDFKTVLRKKIKIKTTMQETGLLALSSKACEIFSLGT